MTDLFPSGRPENALRAFLPLVVLGIDDYVKAKFYFFGRGMNHGPSVQLANAYLDYLDDKPWRSLLKHGLKNWTGSRKGSQNRDVLAWVTELWWWIHFGSGDMIDDTLWSTLGLISRRNGHEALLGLGDYEAGRMKWQWHIASDHAILEALVRAYNGDGLTGEMRTRLKHIHGLLALHALPWPDAQGPRGRIGPSVHIAGNRSDRKTEGHIPLNDLFALAVDWPGHKLPDGWSKPLPDAPWNGWEWRTMEALGLSNVRKHLPEDAQKAFRNHVMDPANDKKFCLVVLHCRGAKLAMPVHILREGLQLQVVSAIINHHSPGAFERMAWREGGQAFATMEVAPKGRWKLVYEDGLPEFQWTDGNKLWTLDPLDNPYRHVVIDQEGIRTI